MEHGGDTEQHDPNKEEEDGAARRPENASAAARNNTELLGVEGAKPKALIPCCE
jgi:hypothetical protein